MSLELERVTRWRLLLGKAAEETLGKAACGAGLRGEGEALLQGEEERIDDSLELVYPGGEGQADTSGELSREEWSRGTRGRKHGSVSGRSMPRVARWLGEIREFFPTDVVALLQKDAIEKRGLKQLLFEPETLAQVEPSVDLVAAVLQLKNMVPETAKEAARDLVRRVVEKLRKQLEQQTQQAVRGALNRSKHSPQRCLPNIDWRRTIQRALKNYDAEHRTVIPEQLFFYGRQQKRNAWNVIIAMDQSGSMAQSLIYGGVMGAILATMPAVETHVVAFNESEVVDLTEHCSDPVDLLFGVQLGGAEDYWMATRYCERFMHTPQRTLYILLADLYDTSPNEARFVAKMEELLARGIKAIGLLAISDHGVPSFNEDLARKLEARGMPCFGCVPDRLPEMLAAALKGEDLSRFKHKKS